MNESKLQPYLCFDGNCREAMTWYQSILGGKLDINTFDEFSGPDWEVPEEQKDKVMHAMLDNGALTMMASDNMPDGKVNFGNSVSLSISGTDEAQLKGFFDKLSEGGTVTMPMDKQIWGDTFGMLTDKYGFHWMINIASPTPEA